MGNKQYHQQTAKLLDLVVRQGIAKKESNLSGDDGNGTGLAMIIGR